MRQRLARWLKNHRESFMGLTGALFWGALGSLGTLLFVTPVTPVTQQILVGEVSLLAGLALGYLSFQEDPR